MKKRRNKKSFFTRFWEAFWRPEMLILPGQIAFFLFLSLIPTITLIGYACAYLNLSNDLIQTVISNSLGNEIADLITPILTSTEITPAFFITLGIGYFVASNGMSSIIVASNTIYGIKDSGFFKRRLKAIFMEVIIVFLFLFVLLVPLLGTQIINIFHYFNLDTETTQYVAFFFNLLDGPVSWIIIFFFIKLIYTMAPDRKVSSKSVNGGSLFTAITWVLITTLYSYYISNYANYSIFYGSLANIVILMLWFYLLSYVLVIGMAMNYHEELEHTGVIEISKVIEESANSAPIMEVEPERKNKKHLKKEEQNKTEKNITSEETITEEKSTSKNKKNPKKEKKQKENNEESPK